MNKERFSIYSPGNFYNPSGDLTLEDVWESITDKTYRDQTYSLQTLLSEGREEEYKSQKRNILPSVSFGGLFDYRSTDKKKLSEVGKYGLISPSGLLIVDLDHLSAVGEGIGLEDLKERLSEDSEIGVRLVFTSPSGDGLKVVCKTEEGRITDKDSYKAVSTALIHFISQRYDIPISREGLDKSGSDITRLCFLCNDPTAKIVDSESVFRPEDHPVPEKTPERDLERERLLRDFANYTTGDGIEEIVQRVEESGRDIAPEYGDYIKLCYSFTALGERGRSLLHRVCRLSDKYRPEDTDRDFNNCLRSGESQSIGTFVNLCKDMGIDVTRPVQTPVYPERPQRKTETKTPVQTAKPEETPDPDSGKIGGKTLEEYLQIPDIGKVVETKREGIQTRYRFETKSGKEEYLTLRSGAMTLICGKSSHGKSKLLQNISLQIAEDMYNSGEEGSVLFFTYEEELSEVLLQFANIHTDMTGLSRYGTPNTEVIRDYYKDGTLNRCTEDNRNKLVLKLSSFKTLHSSGKLRIFYSDLYSQSLCKLIREIAGVIKVKAVFIDYVQLLYREGNRKDRREEIKDICNDLRTTAIDLGLPFVLSAQLNRETPNPSEMSEDNIAESADLTRYANTAVCLWNSYFENVKGGKTAYLQTEDGKRLQSRGFNLGEGGKIYAKISKNRGGTPNIDTILDFTGETGRIPGNEDLPKGGREESNIFD